MEPIRSLMEPTPPLVNGSKTVQGYLFLFKQAAELGLSLILSGILIAVFLGIVDTPGARRAFDEASLANQKLEAHSESTDRFQKDLLEGLRRQRCMTAVSNLPVAAETIASAALSNDPCAWLEYSMRKGKP
jgi:hypothetical protein